MTENHFLETVNQIDVSENEKYMTEKQNKNNTRPVTRWNKAWRALLVLTPLSTVLVPLTGDTTPRLTRHDFIQQTLALIE
nr:hypothetical protein [uncultured Carboxylicivirga sp.]